MCYCFLIGINLSIIPNLILAPFVSSSFLSDGVLPGGPAPVPADVGVPAPEASPLRFARGGVVHPIDPVPVQVPGAVSPRFAMPGVVGSPMSVVSHDSSVTVPFPIPPEVLLRARAVHSDSEEE